MQTAERGRTYSSKNLDPSGTKEHSWQQDERKTPIESGIQKRETRLQPQSLSLTGDFYLGGFEGRRLQRGIMRKKGKGALYRSKNFGGSQKPAKPWGGGGQRRKMSHESYRIL